MRRGRMALLCALLLGGWTLGQGALTGAPAAHGAVSGAKKVCKTVKKHGKKVRQCHVVTPVPTATPTPPPVPFKWKVAMVPCGSDGKGTGCADFHFSITDQDNGTITVKNPDMGYTLQFGQFGIIKADSYSGTNAYYLTTYVKAIKSAPKDGALDSWDPDRYGTLIGATAANGHPYGATTCRAPSFPSITLYNGEHEEGWVCSGSIPGEYMESTFTWAVRLSNRFVAPYTSSAFPVAAVEVHKK